MYFTSLPVGGKPYASAQSRKHQKHPAYAHPARKNTSLQSQLTPSSPFSGKALLQKLLPRRKNMQTVMAGAQHERKEPKNPIPYEALDDLLKTVQPQTSPEVRPLMQDGYEGGLHRLLQVSNRIIFNMNELTQQGHKDVELVVYVDKDRHNQTKSVRDPFTGESVECEFKPEKQRYCIIPTPLKRDSKFKPMLHWSNIAENKNKDIEFLELPRNILHEMKQTAHNQPSEKPAHRFNLDQKDQLADYSEQLFQMLKNVENAKEEMPTEWRDTQPDDYKVGLISKTPDGKEQIQDISRLFPGCDLDKATSNILPTPSLSLEGRSNRDFLEHLFMLDLQG